GCGAVTHDVAGQNPWCASTSDNHRVDVILAVFTQHICANNTGELRNIDEGNRSDDDPNEGFRVRWVSEYHDGHRSQCDGGNRHDDIHDAHDQFIHAFTRNGCNRAQDNCDGQGDTCGCQTN